MQKPTDDQDFEDLEAIYAVEDHALAAVHCDIGSIENQIFAEQEIEKHINDTTH